MITSYRFLDEDKERVAKARANPTPNPSQIDSLITFTEYHTYDEIVEYLNGVADLQSYAKVINIGQTYEGRDTWGLEIQKAGDNAVANIYFHAGNKIYTMEPEVYFGEIENTVYCLNITISRCSCS